MLVSLTSGGFFFPPQALKSNPQGKIIAKVITSINSFVFIATSLCYTQVLKEENKYCITHVHYTLNLI